MKIKSIIALVTGCAISTFGVTAMVNVAQASVDVRFICAAGLDKRTNKCYPTTYAWTGGQKRTIIRWKYKWFNSMDIGNINCLRSINYLQSQECRADLH